MPTQTDLITFPNRDGKLLFGTYHYPTSAKHSDIPVVLLSPGVKMRVGPHRLYNRITEVLVNSGFPVFKFDFAGLGDSEGELERELLSEVYNDTETGMFVNDGIDALNWLEKSKGHTNFILGGLCGGAITGVLIGQRDQRVRGLISLGMTVTLAMGAKNRSEFASKGELRSLGHGYLRNVFSVKSWLRLLTFQSEFSAIYRSMRELLRNKSIFRKNNDTADSKPVPRSEVSNANPLFPPAFFAMAESGRKMLLIFSGADRLYWDFEEKFAQPYSNRLKQHANSFEIQLIEGANHVFSFREWEQEMLTYVSSWLEVHFFHTYGKEHPASRFKLTSQGDPK